MCFFRGFLKMNAKNPHLLKQEFYFRRWGLVIGYDPLFDKFTQRTGVAFAL